VKIYCIKVDALPFCQEVLQIQNLVSGALLRQVGGVFTTSSLIQMFTGKLSSDYEPQGVGYHLFKKKRDKNGVPNWTWMNEYIQFYLHDKGFDCIERNQGMIMDECLGFSKYPNLYSERTTPWDQHDNKSYKYLREQGKEWEESRDDEFRWIDKTKEAKGNIFYFINYSHFHSVISTVESKHKKYHKIAGENVLEILGHYDFNEPDSLFWIFSDHGAWHHPHLGKFPLPEHFYTWAIVKDNTKEPLTFPNKIISMQDFPMFIRSKFGSPIQQFPKDRIFLTEDGRQAVRREVMTTAIACQFPEPNKMDCLLYHICLNRYLLRESVFEKGGLVIETKVKSPKSSKSFGILRKALRENFDWVTK